MQRSPRKDDHDDELHRLEREMIDEVLTHLSSTRLARAQTGASPSGEVNVNDSSDTSDKNHDGAEQT